MTDMKDSGVDWIGTCPRRWQLLPGKAVFTLRNERGNSVEELLSATQLYGMYPQRLLEGVVQTNEDTNLQTFKTVHMNDYVISLRSFQGGFEMSDYEGVCSPAYQVFYSCKPIDFRYYKYLFKSDGFIRKMNSLTVGIREGKNIQYKDFSKVIIPYPSVEEQHRIASYLDLKCISIDNLIDKQNLIIEKLKNYKITLITETVTHGLNPNVTLKETGKKYMGRIPKHWSVYKLKYLFENGDDGLRIGPYGSALKGKTNNVGMYKIYNQANVIANDFSLSRHYISEETFGELKNYEIKPNDVLFSMMGTIGKCCLMPEGYPAGIMDSHLLKAKLNDKVIPEFFVYAYDKDYSLQVISQLSLLSNGSIMNGLNSSILKNVEIAVPPVDEQRKIVRYLNEVCVWIDKNIQNRQTLIWKLREYKNSFIYEIVTGKKNVI